MTRTLRDFLRQRLETPVSAIKNDEKFGGAPEVMAEEFWGPGVCVEGCEGLSQTFRQETTRAALGSEGEGTFPEKSLRKGCVLVDRVRRGGVRLHRHCLGGRGRAQQRGCRASWSCWVWGAWAPGEQTVQALGTATAKCVNSRKEEERRGPAQGQTGTSGREEQ